MALPLLTRPSAASDSSRSLEALSLLFGEALGRDVAVRLWDGTTLAPPHPRFTLIVTAACALRAALLPPLDLNPGRAYVDGLLDIEGDIEAAIDAMWEAGAKLGRPAAARLAAILLRLPHPPPPAADGVARLHGRRHTRERDADAVAFHYDAPVEFFRSFLGDDLIYSCAYWDDGAQSLAAAQTAKIDHVLRKLRLRPGQTLLDVGCGWGSLVVHAARRYGVQAVGITISREQCREANARIERAGLADRARVEFCDYRELDSRSFDAIVSVGMAEHVGLERLPAYFAALGRALRPGGTLLNHAIGQLDGARYRASGFMGRYIFPDGDLVAISTLLRAAEDAGFEVRDVENLREHYARTLRAWLARLETARAAAIGLTSERTYRRWRLYFAGSALGFARGRMAVYQALLCKRAAGGDAGLPATRRDWYAAPLAQAESAVPAAHA